MLAIRSALAGALLLIACLPAAAQEVEIGHVSKKAYLGAIGVRASGGQEKLTYRQALWADETVWTNAQQDTTLRFLDDTKLQVGENSQVLLDRFVYDPAAGTGEMVVDFARGGFRFITGAMKNKEGFRLSTPSAFIGIRGTDFKLLITPFGGTIVAVLEGTVEVTPRGGGEGVTAQAGQSVTVSSPTAAPSVDVGDQVGDRFGLGDNPY